MEGHASFILEKELSTPALVDTGASVSIIPKQILEASGSSLELERCDRKIFGVTGASLKLVGKHTRTLKLGFDNTKTHTFYVADVDIKYLILGTDFLHPNKLFPIPHCKILAQEGGLSVRMQTLAETTLEVINSVFSVPDTVKNMEAEEECKKILESFPELTREPSYNDPPKHAHVLDIQLTSYQAIRQRARPCSHKDQMAVDSNFSELLQKGAVVKGSSEFVSPICIVRKKDGSPRVCVDYSRLNKFTVPLNFPIPQIQSLAAKLTSSHLWYSVLDLKEAYHSLPLTPRASRLAGIITNHGCYRPLRTPFGLTNAPSKFCELVADMISGLEESVFSYIDDFLVFSKSLEDHYLHLKALLSRLRAFGMFVNSKKCVFARNTVVFLGHEVSKSGLRPLADKVEAISKIAPPTTLTDLRRFLGSLGYYRVFLPGLAGVLDPLYQLLAGPKRPKRSRLVWEVKHQRAFDRAILLLKKATNLAFDDINAPLILSTDASLSHAGAVLEQFISQESENTRPLAFFSQAFPKTVKVRSTFHRELMALYLSVRHFKHQLSGRALIVRTDHAALVQAIENVNGEHSIQEDRMIAYIKEYLPRMTHIKGELNLFADFLSRPADSEPKPGASTDEGKQPALKEVTLGSDSGVCSSQEVRNGIMALSDNFHPSHKLSLELIALQQKAEWSSIEQIKQSLEPNKSDLQVEQQTIWENELSVYGVRSSDHENFRPIVPRSLRVMAYHSLHDTLHQGQTRSIFLISSFYFWPDMASDISEWVKACPKCQSSKIKRHNRQALKNYPGKFQRFHTIHLDLVGPLPDSQGFRYILTMRDRGTGFAIAAPMEDKSAYTLRMVLIHHLIGKFGIPDTFITDNGGEFVSGIFSDLCLDLGIRHKRITSFHPQSNGFIERIHRILKTAFRAMEDPSDWVNQLPFVILTLNNLTCDSNTFTPHQHTFGQAGRLPNTFLFPQARFNSEQPSIGETYAFFENMRQHERSARPLPNRSSYIEDTLFTAPKVWVRNDGHKKSLRPLYCGPYNVVDRQEKYFSLITEQGITNISVDRLKAAYFPSPTGPEGSSDADSDSGEVEEAQEDRPNRIRRLPPYLEDYQLG